MVDQMLDNEIEKVIEIGKKGSKPYVDTDIVVKKKNH